jgi:hypothetical protein
MRRLSLLDLVVLLALLALLLWIGRSEFPRFAERAAPPPPVPTATPPAS